MLNTASPFAACSPTTDIAIAPTTFAPLARSSASVIASHGRTLHALTEKPNALSKPLCASGRMPVTTPTPKNASNNSFPGWTTTTSFVPMVASATLRRSAAAPKVQPLEGSQVPRVSGLHVGSCGWLHNAEESEALLWVRRSTLCYVQLLSSDSAAEFGQCKTGVVR